MKWVIRTIVQVVFFVLMVPLYLFVVVCNWTIELLDWAFEGKSPMDDRFW